MAWVFSCQATMQSMLDLALHPCPKEGTAWSNDGWFRVSPLGSLGWGLPIETRRAGLEPPNDLIQRGALAASSVLPVLKSVTCLSAGFIYLVLFKRVSCSVPKTANSHQFSRWVNDFMPWTCTHFRCNMLQSEAPNAYTCGSIKWGMSCNTFVQLAQTSFEHLPLPIPCSWSHCIWFSSQYPSESAVSFRPSTINLIFWAIDPCWHLERQAKPHWLQGFNPKMVDSTPEKGLRPY